jgi:hypothetical protein
MKTQIHKTAKPRPEQLNKLVFNKTKKRVDTFIKHDRLKRVNDKNQNDRLEILKTKYEQEIQAKERELETLKAKLASLQAFVHESEKLGNPESAPDRYTDKGLTDSILDALYRLWPDGAADKRGLTAREITDYILAHGYKPPTGGQSFDISIAVTLQRLKEQRRVEKKREEGNNFFKPRDLYKPFMK